MDTTTKAVHTPGPWYIGADGSNTHGDRTTKIWGNDSTFVALVTQSGLTKHSDTADANATLIAAAPTMLAALVAIESCLAPEDNDYAAQKVRVAIRKATGGAA